MLSFLFVIFIFGGVRLFLFDMMPMINEDMDIPATYFAVASMRSKGRRAVPDCSVFGIHLTRMCSNFFSSQITSVQLMELIHIHGADKQGIFLLTFLPYSVVSTPFSLYLLFSSVLCASDQSINQPINEKCVIMNEAIGVTVIGTPTFVM